LAASFQRLDICLNSFEVLPREFVRGIQLQRDLELLERRIQFPLFGKLVRNEVISTSSRLEPPFARSNLNRFFQKTL
jgi:hypothetical protein